MKKRVISHLKSDIKHEMSAAKEDRKLVKELKHKKKHHKKHEAKESKKHEKAEHHKKKHHAKKKHVKKVVKKKMHEKAIEKAMHHPDKLGAGAKKRKHLSGKNKMKVVMKEFKRGTLNSGSGAKVTNPKQAVAIAYSEARKANKK